MKIRGVCARHNISGQTYCGWKRTYGGMQVDELRQARALAEENGRLKHIVPSRRLISAKAAGDSPLPRAMVTHQITTSVNSSCFTTMVPLRPVRMSQINSTSETTFTSCVRSRPSRLAQFLNATAVIVSCCLLTQCAFSLHDPGSSQLRAAVEKNLPKNSIVGMWHRRLVVGNVTELWSFLFKSDGTGVSRYVLNDEGGNFLMSNLSTEKQYEFDWTYEGGGIWKAHGNPKFNLSSCNGFSFRISGNRLLANRPEMFGASEFIYTRVE